MALLEIKNLNVTYQTKDRKIKAVEDVSLTIEQGAPLGIVGESGSGKSTLAMAVLRMLPASTLVEGAVSLKGTDLLSLSDEKLRALRWKELSVVFQKSMNLLSPVHRIDRQLIDMYRVHEPKAAAGDVRKILARLLEMVNLPERVLKSYPHELSGGQLQRVSIAASLMHNPPSSPHQE